MTIITLPPLPKPVGKILYAGPYHHIRQTEGAFDADQLRARDLEVARIVLEGAADFCYDQRSNWSVEDVGQVALENAGDAIKKLEVKHYE